MKKIMAILAACLLSVMVIGCGSGSAQEDTPEQAVINTINAFKEADNEALIKYLGDGYGDAEIFNEEDKETLAAIYSKLSCEIISSEVSDDTAIVVADITSADMSNVIENYINNAMAEAFSGDELSDERMMEILKETIEQSETITNTVEINLTKGENNWVVAVDDALADAISGNIMSLEDTYGI